MDMDHKNLRTGAVFGNAPVPLGSMWAELSELEDRLADRLLAMPPGSRVIGETMGWRLREREGMIELACGRIDGRRLVDLRSRFEISLTWVDFDEDELQLQIDALRDALARMEH